MTPDELKKHSPFSTYDFLGYLIPGSTFIATGFFFDRWLSSAMPNSDLTLLFNNFAQVIKGVNTGEDANALNSIIAIILIFIVCYTVGHIIATLSSFFIDRYLIKSGVRYPLVNLLDGQNKHQLVSVERIYETRAKSSLFILYLILLMILQIILMSFDATVLNYKWWVLGATIIFFSVLLVPFSSKIAKVFGYLPSKLGALVEGHLDMAGQVDTKFSDLILKSIKNDFDIDLKDATHSRNYSNAYWLMFLKVTDRSSVAQSMLFNWLHLYSYARNTSTSFFLTSVYIVFAFILNGQEIVHSPEYEPTYYFSIFFITSLLISIVLLIRYYYLFSSYYTKFLLRSYYYASVHEVKAELEVTMSN